MDERQHDMRVIKEELQKEPGSNPVFQREVMRLISLTSEFELEINKTRLPYSELLSVKEALTFGMELNLKQQNDEMMNEISRIKTNFNTKRSAMSTTISSITRPVFVSNKKEGLFDSPLNPLFKF